MDQTVDVAVRQNRLQYLKSGRSHRLYGAANANAKSARFLGIRDDPAAINGNSRVNNKMVKYVVLTALLTFHRRVPYCSLLFVTVRYCSEQFQNVFSKLQRNLNLLKKNYKVL